MNIVFAGSPDFSVRSLEALIVAGHHISGVFTQPDRPAGRGKKLQMSPVKRAALEHDLPIFQPERLKQFDLGSLETPDLMVVVAYGLILPQRVLNWPRLGCVNVHASLLPRWRGAAPIQRAIEAGDTESGVCIMQMDAGLDTGDVLKTVKTPISKDDTGGSLHDRLAELGASALVETIAEIENGAASPIPQPEQGVTYAEKLRKEEAEINWSLPAEVIERRIRAFNPWPVTWTGFRGKPLKIWAGMITEGESTPGSILEISKSGITVATGDAALCISRLQPAGKKPMNAADFANGNQIQPGEYMGQSEDSGRLTTPG